jgi:hypothetical protein
MSKDRKTRSDKKFRVNPSLEFETHEKLKMLALACEVTKTKMAETIIDMVLNDVKSVENLQKNLGVDNVFRVRATDINGKVFLRHENFI